LHWAGLQKHKHNPQNVENKHVSPATSTHTNPAHTPPPEERKQTEAEEGKMLNVETMGKKCSRGEGWTVIISHEN
jgi:hypothetical protein